MQMMKKQSILKKKTLASFHKPSLTKHNSERCVDNWSIKKKNDSGLF